VPINENRTRGRDFARPRGHAVERSNHRKKSIRNALRIFEDSAATFIPYGGGMSASRTACSEFGPTTVSFCPSSGEVPISP
jgi:hypothetical protein